MNERIKKAINDNIVKPLLDEKMYTISGTVVRTYYEEETSDVEARNYNAADVEVVLPSTGFKHIFHRVPIIISGTMGGVKGARIKKGDKVSMSFEGGDAKNPRIKGRVYEDPKKINKSLKSDAGNYTPEYTSRI